MISNLVKMQCESMFFRGYASGSGGSYRHREAEDYFSKYYSRDSASVVDAVMELESRLAEVEKERDNLKKEVGWFKSKVVFDSDGDIV